RERLQQCEAVAGGAVADARPLLVAERPGLPGRLGRREEQVLVEVVGERDDHARRAGAPLEPDLAVASGPLRRVRARRPVDEAVLADGGPAYDLPGVCERLAPEPQDARDPRKAVRR